MQIIKKISFLVVAFVLIGMIAFAQKPASGSKGLVAGLANFITGTVGGSSNMNTLGFRYYLADDMALRVSLGVATGSTTTTPDDSTEFKSKTGTGIGLSAGVEKVLGGGDKLDVYTGAELGFVMGGKASLDTTASSAAASSTYESSRETGGSTTITFNVLGGFRFFFTDHLAIGAELSWGLTNYTAKVGKYTSTTVAGGTTTNVDVDKGSKVSTMTIGNGGAFVTLGWYF